MNQSIRLFTIVFIIMALSHGALSIKDGAYPKTILDSAGRTITILVPIDRIIVLNSDAAEAVVTLGAGETIVGITDEVLGRSSHLPGPKGKKVIGTSQMGGEIDYELIGEIASTENGTPSDLLVIGFSGVGKNYGAAEVEKKLALFGIANAGLDFYRPENLSREMTALGLNGDVFVVYSDVLYGMESVAGLAYLAQILHPETDINPEIIYREYFERLGLYFPDNRTFVYKEDYS